MPKLLITLLMLLLLMAYKKPYLPDSKRAADIRTIIWPRLQKRLQNLGLRDDQPVYIRIFKDSHLLEVWVRSGKQYKLFNKYMICSFSGGLGTKTRNGDGKCPEGYYTIKPAQLNPVSNYHLAINVGYPNAYDQQHDYTGNSIMIHGNCVSIGCYAMTDPQIEEIYTMVYEAFAHGQQSISVDIFPFKLTNERLDAYSEWPNLPFWKSLKPGYDMFEHTHVPPVVDVVNKNYVFK